jgi:hypothetical protein
MFWTLEIPFKTGFTVFGPKRDDVTGDWRKLHNEKRIKESGRKINKEDKYKYVNK